MIPQQHIRDVIRAALCTVTAQSLKYTARRKDKLETLGVTAGDFFSMCLATGGGSSSFIFSLEMRLSFSTGNELLDIWLLNQKQLKMPSKCEFGNATRQ